MLMSTQGLGWDLQHLEVMQGTYTHTVAIIVSSDTDTIEYFLAVVARRAITIY